MKQTIIGFTGISGVGKTSFLRKVSEEVEFQHLTGGSLIAAARAATHHVRDNLRHADLEENQRLLIRGFMKVMDPEAAVVIMDGHVIIDGADGITEIASQVFFELGVNLMVHFEAEPSRILDNRANDERRDRPPLSVDALQDHQERSEQRALEVARDLGIDFIKVRHLDLASFIERVRGHVRDNEASRPPA